ncbi:MAG: hypothetical protein AABX28_00705 [Nanoarchaeota archaeon]
MGYDLIIIDSIICDSYLEIMYDGDNPNRKPLLELQTMSADLIANKKDGLLLITSKTKEVMEKKYFNNALPISLSCLLGACKEIDIFSKDEVDSIVKASSLLFWKKVKFCVLTGNSLLKERLSFLKFKVYDFSETQKLFSEL